LKLKSDIPKLLGKVYVVFNDPNPAKKYRNPANADFNDYVFVGSLADAMVDLVGDVLRTETTISVAGVFTDGLLAANLVAELYPNACRECGNCGKKLVNAYNDAGSGHCGSCGIFMCHSCLAPDLFRDGKSCDNCQ
jgi:hypothetical protein